MSHPEDPSRSELSLVAAALRQDWPISPKAKLAMLQQAMNLADPPEGTPVPRRTQLAAMKVVALFCKLAIDQQKVDLARERQARGEDDVTDRAGGVDPAAAERALRAERRTRRVGPVPVNPPPPPGYFPAGYFPAPYFPAGFYTPPTAPLAPGAPAAAPRTPKWFPGLTRHRRRAR